MKALIVTTHRSFPGGVEQVNRTLESILKEWNYEVDYLTADGPHTFWENIFKKVLSPAGVTWWRWTKMERAAKASYDLIIANGEHALGMSHPKLLNYFHGSYLGLRGERSRLQKSFWTLSYLSFLQVLAARSKKVLSVSLYLNSILKKQGIAVSQVLSPPIDLERFRPTPEEKQGTYLFVGSGAFLNKGFDLLEALALKGQDITCISKTACSPHLKFLTDVPSLEMPRYYNRFRFFLFPSRFESLGLAPLEAMACGLPVIMFNVGAGQELQKIIPEFVLDLKNQNTVEHFLERISLIEKDYDSYSLKARRFVEEQYSLESFKNRLKSILQEFNHA